MTTKPAPGCECLASGNSKTRLVDVLARSTGADVLTVERLSCDDVHDMIRSLITVRDLTQVDRILVAEVPARPGVHYTPGSERFALTLFTAFLIAVFGMCSFFGWVLL